jgi:hypothetical protein
LLGQLPSASGHSTSLEQHIAEPPSFFPDDYSWAKAALAFAQSRTRTPFQVQCLDDRKEIHLYLPEDLRQRLKRLPPEIQTDDRLWVLTTDRDAVMREIRACRKEDQRWPRVHLLWQQQPAMEWLHDKILYAFGRHDAPVVGVPALRPGESIVIATGILPNRKGHPLIQRWAGIRFEGDTLRERLELSALIERTRLGRDEIPNPAADGDLSQLQRLIGPAVDAMREELRQARRAFDDSVRPELDRQLERLVAFRDTRNAQLELRFEKLSHVRDAEKRKVANLYEEYKTWIRDTLTTEDHPSIRVAAIFTGKGGR